MRLRDAKRYPAQPEYAKKEKETVFQDCESLLPPPRFNLLSEFNIIKRRSPVNQTLILWLTLGSPSRVSIINISAPDESRMFIVDMNSVVVSGGWMGS